MVSCLLVYYYVPVHGDLIKWCRFWYLILHKIFVIMVIMTSSVHFVEILHHCILLGYLLVYIKSTVTVCSIRYFNCQKIGLFYCLTNDSLRYCLMLKETLRSPVYPTKILPGARALSVTVNNGRLIAGL